MKDDDEGGEDGTPGTTSNRNVKTKKRRRKMFTYAKDVSSMAHIRADEKRNEREKEFVKVEVRERLLGENAKEMKARRRRGRRGAKTRWRLERRGEGVGG